MPSENHALIPVFTGTLAGNVAQLVDARTLHSFLGIGKYFSNWIRQRIREYGFEQDQDFKSFCQNGQKPSGGRPVREYHLTLDMAKELSMVERNEQGRRARRYFIECEKRLVEVDPAAVASIAGTTIGTDGMRCLSAVVEGKLKQLPANTKRGARTHLWAQVHKAFSVVTAEDIPSDQLDNARNFIAAYVLEGQWLPRAIASDECEFAYADRVNLYALCCHMVELRTIYRQYQLKDALNMLGSRAGIEMYGHLDDGCAIASRYMPRLTPNQSQPALY